MSLPANTVIDRGSPSDLSMSPRFSILKRLPPPPAPPSDLESCLKHTQEPQTREEIAQRRTSVTVLLNPANGQPYRLKPLPVPPIKPEPPLKRSTAVSETLGFVYCEPENKFLSRKSVNSAIEPPGLTNSLNSMFGFPESLGKEAGKRKNAVIRVTQPTPEEPKPSIPPREFKLVKAFWDSEPQEPGELLFFAGDLIKILDQQDDEWFVPFWF